MIDDIERIAAEGEARLLACTNVDDVRAIEAELLGKRSQLSSVKQGLGALDPDARKTVGRAVNDARARLEAAAASRRHELEVRDLDQRLEVERLDLTEFAGRGRRYGHKHVVTQAAERLEDVFIGLGFTIAEGPEVEDDFHNFSALNFPPGHPARDMYDTLYLDYGDPGSTLLRTHTSPVQIRVMQTMPPPIYMIMPGRVFRQDTADATHMPVFHQI